MGEERLQPVPSPPAARPLLQHSLDMGGQHTAQAMHSASPAARGAPSQQAGRAVQPWGSPSAYHHTRLVQLGVLAACGLEACGGVCPTQ